MARNESQLEKEIESRYPKMKPSELDEFITWAAGLRLPVLVIGKPGMGKTSIMQQAAKQLGWSIMISHPVIDDPTDYKGMPFTYKDQVTFIDVDGKKHRKEIQKASFLPFGDLERLVATDEPMIHFADDLGQAAKLTQAAYMQLMLNRAINGHKVSDKVVFMAASNRKEDKAGVTAMIEPLKDRYASIVEIVSDVDDWISWAIAANMPYELMAYIRYKPDVLSAWRPTSDFTRTPTPRSLASVGDMLNGNVPGHLMQRAFTGAIGKEHAMEFVGFLSICRDLPPPEQVLLDPRKAPVPEKAASKYALCGALASRASEQTIEAIITYANRLPDEFSVLLVRDAILRDKAKLCHNKQFIDWVAKHQDVLI